MRSLLISTLLAITINASKCQPPNPVPNPTPAPTPVPTTTTTSTSTTSTTTTTLPPRIEGCRFPQGASLSISPLTRNFDKAVNNVISTITKCSIGSDCTHGLLDQDFLYEVASDLRLKGFCAGQHINGVTDEIAVSCTTLSDDGLTCKISNCKTPWEGKHVAHFGVGKVVWCPGADRDSWIPSSESCDITPTPFPVPTPSPSPVPAPNNQCPVKAAGDYFVDLHISTIGNNPQRYTATAKYCGFPIRSDIFKSCGTKCCTLGVDGGSDVAIICERELSGIPSWRASDSLQIQVEDNPYNVKVLSGNGILSACGKSGCSNEITF